MHSTDEKEEETLRRVHRLSAQGQLRRLRALSQRQVPSNMQAASMREVDREEGEWIPLLFQICS